MKDAVKSGKLYYVTCIEWKSDLSDALTKLNPDLSIRFNNILSTGIWYIKLDEQLRLLIGKFGS